MNNHFVFQVLKEWSNVKKVIVRDEKKLGSPQVVIHFLGNKSPTVVTHESKWEEEFIGTPEQNENSALNSVVSALDAQQRNAQNHLLSIEQQISLRQSIINKSLTALQDSITHQNQIRRAVHLHVIIISIRF